MTPTEAAQLAGRLVDWFPGEFYGEAVRNATARQFAEAMLAWDREIASRAVQSIAESVYRFPSFATLRDAYASEGGDVPDPGRNMSPRVERPRLTPEEQERADEAMHAAIRAARERKLRAIPDAGTPADGSI